MSRQSSNNSTLYFIVGGLLVAVLAIGYFAFSRTDVGGAGGSADVAAPAPAADTGTKFKLDVGKDGAVSGTFEDSE